MKNIFFTAILLMGSFSCFAEKSSVCKIKLINYPENSQVLYEATGWNKIMDSVTLNECLYHIMNMQPVLFKNYEVIKYKYQQDGKTKAKGRFIQHRH